MSKRKRLKIFVLLIALATGFGAFWYARKTGVIWERQVSRANFQRRTPTWKPTAPGATRLSRASRTRNASPATPTIRLFWGGSRRRFMPTSEIAPRAMWSIKARMRT